jgi:hypothetical protein
MPAAAPAGGSIAENVAINAPMTPPCAAPLAVATATSIDGGCFASHCCASAVLASSTFMAREARVARTRSGGGGARRRGGGGGGVRSFDLSLDAWRQMTPG